MLVLRVYLYLVMKCKNLIVEICVFVIEIYYEGRRVIGVMYKKNGKLYIIDVKEVILFGGVFNML